MMTSDVWDALSAGDDFIERAKAGMGLKDTNAPSLSADDMKAILVLATYLRIRDGEPV